MKGFVVVVAVLGVLYAIDLFMFNGMYSATASRVGSEFFRRVF